MTPRPFYWRGKMRLGTDKRTPSSPVVRVRPEVYWLVRRIAMRRGLHLTQVMDLLLADLPEAKRRRRAA